MAITSHSQHNNDWRRYSILSEEFSDRNWRKKQQKQIPTVEKKTKIFPVKFIGFNSRPGNPRFKYLPVNHSIDSGLFLDLFFFFFRFVLFLKYCRQLFLDVESRYLSNLFSLIVLHRSISVNIPWQKGRESENKSTHTTTCKSCKNNN